jgi:hypothetical protein
MRRTHSHGAKTDAGSNPVEMAVLGAWCEQPEISTHLSLTSVMRPVTSVVATIAA